MIKEVCKREVFLKRKLDQNTLNEYLKSKTKEEKKYSSEKQDLIREIVNTLKDEDKALIHLKFWENHSIQEIAYKTGKRTKTIEKRLKEILENLKILFLLELNTNKGKL